VSLPAVPAGPGYEAIVRRVADARPLSGRPGARGV